MSEVVLYDRYIQFLQQYYYQCEHLFLIDYLKSLETIFIVYTFYYLLEARYFTLIRTTRMKYYVVNCSKA